jgi:large subunit ribosomal protein L1
MPKPGKRYRENLEKLPREPVSLEKAVEALKSLSKTKFDQSIEVCMHLGIDPRQADQMIRGSLSLPHGIGATRRVVAFCSPEKVQAALDAGAIKAGGEDLVAEIEGGWMEFDVAVAEPPMMRVISKLGRTLGPKGLMPSPKAGTVTPDVEQAVKEYAAGKVEFRNDSGGNVHAVIGKQSFDDTQLKENAEHFIGQIQKLKPSAAKGAYIKKVSVAGTMTPGVLVEV